MNFLFAMFLQMVPSTECMVESPAQYEAGSQKFCDSGAFRLVQIFAEDNRFEAKMTFSAEGLEMFNKEPGVFYRIFIPIIQKFHMQERIIATMSFWEYEDGKLGACWADEASQRYLCRLTEEEEDEGIEN